MAPDQEWVRRRIGTYENTFRLSTLRSDRELIVWQPVSERDDLRLMLLEFWRDRHRIRVHIGPQRTSSPRERTRERGPSGSRSGPQRPCRAVTGFAPTSHSIASCGLAVSPPAAAGQRCALTAADRSSRPQLPLLQRGTLDAPPSRASISTGTTHPQVSFRCTYRRCCRFGKVVCLYPQSDGPENPIEFDDAEPLI